MKIIVNKEETLKSLKKVQGITEKRTTMPILNNIIISAKDNITIKATNLENSIISYSKGNIEMDGTICVPSKKFFEIIKSLPEETITIEQIDKNISIRSGKTTFKIFSQPPEDFPAIKIPDPENSTTIKRSEFIKALNKVEYAIYPDETRLSLNGVYIHKIDGKIRFVTSDSFRLCYYEFPFEGNIENILISKKATTEIIKIFSTEESENIEVSMEDNYVSLKTEDTIFITRLREVKFPNYVDVLPLENPFKSYIEKDKILKSLQRLLVITEESTKGVMFSMRQDSISIKGVNMEIGEGEDEVEHIYDGESLDIGFNAQFLIDAISNIEADKVEMSIRDANKAVMITGDENYRAVVMPIKI